MAEEMDIVANFKVGKVDISNLKAAIDSEIAKTTTATVASAGVGKGKKSGAGGGGDVGALLDMFAAEALGDIKSILNDVVRTLGMILGVLLILKVIADILSALWKGFEMVGKVWGVLMELVGKIVQPFANLLIPLMIPFLYLFATIGRVLNLLLYPVFSLLMKAFSGGSSAMEKAVLQIMQGDLFGGILTIAESFGNSMEQVRSQIESVLLPIFGLLGRWLQSFLTLDTSKMHEIFNKIFGEELGGVINKLFDAFYYLTSALIGFAVQIAGPEAIGKMLYPVPSDVVKDVGEERINEMHKIFGEMEIANISKTNEGFKKGASIAQTLQGLWDKLAVARDAIGKFADIIEGIVRTFSGVQGTDWKSLGVCSVEPSQEENMSMAWDDMTEEMKNSADYLEVFKNVGLKGVIEKLVLSIKLFIENAIDKIKAAIINFLDNQWKTAVTNIENWSGVIGDWYDEIKDKRFMDIVTGIITSWIKENLKPTTCPIYGDFISRGGQITAFSPDDTVFGVKNASGIGGGGTTVNNFYITGNGDSFLEKKVREVIEQEASKTSRNGYFQKGY